MEVFVRVMTGAHNALWDDGDSFEGTKESVHTTLTLLLHHYKQHVGVKWRVRTRQHFQSDPDGILGVVGGVMPAEVDPRHGVYCLTTPRQTDNWMFPFRRSFLPLQEDAPNDNGLNSDGAKEACESW